MECPEIEEGRSYDGGEEGGYSNEDTCYANQTSVLKIENQACHKTGKEILCLQCPKNSPC